MGLPRTVLLLATFIATTLPLAATGTTPDEARTSPPALDLGFPSAVEARVLGSEAVASLPPMPAGLRLERVLLSTDAAAATRATTGPELLYVESGEIEVTDDLGIGTRLATGNSLMLNEGVRYTARSGLAETSMLLRLSVARAVGDEPAPRSEGATDLIGAEVASLPTTPARLFLARVTWPAGAAHPPSHVNGPMAVIGESGTLMIGAEGHVLAVSASRPLLINAGATIWQRNAGETAAAVLVAGVIPEGVPAMSPVAAVTPAVTPPTATTIATVAPPTVTPVPPPTFTPAPSPTLPPAPPPTIPPISTAVADPDPRASGGVLVYAAKVHAQWDLVAYDVGLDQSMELTGWPGTDEWAPAFSHAGRRLAYLSERSGTAQVWVMDAIGGSSRQVTDHPPPDEITYVAWSADDRSLIATVRAPDGQSRLMSVPVEGGALAEYWSDWSGFATIAADGRWAFVTWVGSETDIYGVAPDGTSYPLAITAEDEDVPNIDPSGTRLAYNAGLKGNRRIQIVPAAGGEPIVLPQIGEDDSNPVWSPDGSALAIVATTDEWDDIWIVPVFDGEPLLLNLPSRERLWYLTWAA